MKNTMFLAAAFALLLPIGAYGQNLSATVPFGFTANRVQLPAGEYSLKTDIVWTRGIIQIQNAATGRSTFIGSASRSYTRGETQPRLVFRAANGKWALAEVWTDQVGYRMRLPNPPEGAKIQMATVFLHRAAKGD